MKLKKVTKHPCLKGLLWAIMYQKNNKHTSLRHSKRKALPRYKLQHRALICKSISLSRAEWLSRTMFHIPDPDQSPKKHFGRQQTYSVFSFSGTGGFHSPCLQSQQLPRKEVQLFSPQSRSPAAESLHTHQPSPSIPNPKHTREQDSTSNSWGQHVTVQSQLIRDAKNRAAS